MTTKTTDERRLRVVAYLRVSTERQAEEGFGLDVQRSTIKAWAAARGYRIVGWASDEGVSGASALDGRHGLLDALNAVESGRCEGIVVARLDRLARDLVQQEALLREVWRHGRRLYSTSSSEDAYLDPDGADGDPSRALIRQVLGAVAAYERAMIRLRMEAGKQRKRDAGGYVGGGVPFGYTVEGRELVPVEDQQRTLARIAQLAALGESSRAICSVLADEGHRPPRGEQWHSAAVAKIIRRTSELAAAQ